MDIDIAIEAPWPEVTDWEALALRAREAAAAVAPEIDHARLTASIVFSDDADVCALNREWRGKDKPTNVLSFPMLSRDELLALNEQGPPAMIGDIVLAAETCAREAAEKGLRIQDHAAHLLIHGLLHLAGYDHETGSDDADQMEALETKALALLGIANPYEGSIQN